MERPAGSQREMRREEAEGVQSLKREKCKAGEAPGGVGWGWGGRVQGCLPSESFLQFQPEEKGERLVCILRERRSLRGCREWKCCPEDSNRKPVGAGKDSPS